MSAISTRSPAANSIASTGLGVSKRSCSSSSNVDVSYTDTRLFPMTASFAPLLLIAIAVGSSNPRDRSAAAMRVAAGRHPTGAVVVVGCAPTALVEAVRLALDGTWAPAVVVGLPVGFVGAAEAKRLVRESGLPSITNVGEKGGSAVAAAVVNALGRLADGDG